MDSRATLEGLYRRLLTIFKSERTHPEIIAANGSEPRKIPPTAQPLLAGIGLTQFIDEVPGGEAAGCVEGA